MREEKSVYLFGMMKEGCMGEGGREGWIFDIYSV